MISNMVEDRKSSYFILINLVESGFEISIKVFLSQNLYSKLKELIFAEPEESVRNKIIQFICRSVRHSNYLLLKQLYDSGLVYVSFFLILDFD